MRLLPQDLDLHRSQIDRDGMQRAMAYPAVDLCDHDGAVRALDDRPRRLKLVLVAVEDSELLPYRVEHLVDEDRSGPPVLRARVRHDHNLLVREDA